MWSTDICCHRELIHHWIWAKHAAWCFWVFDHFFLAWWAELNFSLTDPTRSAFLNRIALCFQWRKTQTFTMFQRKSADERKTDLSGYRSNGEACEVFSERLLWSVSAEVGEDDRLDRHSAHRTQFVPLLQLSGADVAGNEVSSSPVNDAAVLRPRLANETRVQAGLGQSPLCRHATLQVGGGGGWVSGGGCWCEFLRLERRREELRRWGRWLWRRAKLLGGWAKLLGGVSNREGGVWQALWRQGRFSTFPIWKINAIVLQIRTFKKHIHSCVNTMIFCRLSLMWHWCSKNQLKKISACPHPIQQGAPSAHHHDLNDWGQSRTFRGKLFIKSISSALHVKCRTVLIIKITNTHFLLVEGLTRIFFLP